MKKLFCGILAVMIIGCSVSLAVMAETNTQDSLDTIGEEEYIYYSDLFYGYSAYLTAYLTNLESKTTNATNDILNEYITTDHFKASAWVESFGIACDLTEVAKYVSDNIGLSTFKFNEELDKANQKFVEELCAVNASTAKAFGEGNKYAKNINKFLNVAEGIDKLALEKKDELTDADKATLYDILMGRAFVGLKEVFAGSEAHLTALQGELYAVLSETTDLIKDITGTVDFAKALALSIAMQETQKELIQDIIDTQSSSSTLYKGMVRLKNQLEGGFVTYFTGTYIADKVYNEIIGYLPDLTKKAVSQGWFSCAPTVVAVAELVNDIVFKGWLGYDYSEYASAVMLTQYASDLYNGVRTKASVFSSQFDNGEIKKYETLYTAYTTMKAAAFEECQNIAIYNSEHNLAYMESVKGYFDAEDAYQEYIEEVKTSIKANPKENRIITDYGEWKINNNVIFQNASDNIVNDVIYAVNGRATQEIYSESYDILIKDSLSISKISTRNRLSTSSRDVHVHIDDLFYIIPKSSNEAYNIYFDSIDITTNSLKISSYMGTTTNIYLRNSNITINNTFEIDSKRYVYIDEGSILKTNDIVVQAEGGQYNSKIIVNNGQLKCNNLHLKKAPQSSVAYGSAAQSYLTLNEDTSLVEIMGDLIVDGVTDYRVTTGNISINKGSMYVYGNVSFSSIYNYTAGYGKVVLCGENIQTIKNVPVYNLEIDNPLGIILESDLSVYGNLDTNNNSVKQNGYSIRLNTNSQIYGDSHFNRVFVDSSCSLVSNLYCESLVMNNSAKATLTIPEKIKLTVLGDLEITYMNTVKNYGELEVVGNLSLRKEGGSGWGNTKFYNYNLTGVFGDVVCGSYSYIYMENEGSVLSVKGDVNLTSNSYCKVTSGTTILLGNEKQLITNYNCPTFIIENESKEGVVFNSAISPSVLFDHKGNAFTLYNGGLGSTFVDYDGDGTKDNVDPVPTEKESDYFKLNGASLTLHHNLTVNYKADKALFEEIGYTDPYIVFEIGGKKITVNTYSVEGERYIFRFRDIAPNQMNDTIYATLYATYNGVEYVSEVKEYSIAEYCYATLENYAADEYAKLRTLLVDLLHYGAQSQLYTGYNAENPVNAKLTEAQLAWGTLEDPVLTNSLNTAYKTVENPTITWKGASLNLSDSVSIKFKFIAEEIEGLNLKIVGETGEWNIAAAHFVLEDGVYSVCFSGLNAAQMSEKVYFTMYKDGVAVSNTVCYSIESYAYRKQDSSTEHLSDLVKAMMKYGNAARSYAA